MLPLTYGDGVADRINTAAPKGVDAVLDAFGGGYVELALSMRIGPKRINTIIDFAAAAEHGVLTVRHVCRIQRRRPFRSRRIGRGR